MDEVPLLGERRELPTKERFIAYFNANRSSIRISFLAIAIYFLFTTSWLWTTGIWGGGGRMPKYVGSLNETFMGKFSAQRAMIYLEKLTLKPHMYNSKENLLVRQQIETYLLKIQTLYQKNGRSLIVDSNDKINFTSYANWYYESNNILARIPGRFGDQNKSSKAVPALLVSAHFDSTPVSHGVTDDGIGIASMLQVLKALLYQPQLEHDVIFNFNNGEEMGLLGGNTFLLSPWAKDVKGFINLEGTGSAAGTRSMLFRTNSFELTKSYKKSVPFPHSSILFNDLMQFVGSDTDYRPYAAIRGIQGVDIAFYTYRYLYHTPRDDLEHINPLSVQHMGDNLIAMIVNTCSNSTSTQQTNIGRLDLLKPLENPNVNLPTAGFLFYDILGIFMIVSKHGVYFGFVISMALVYALGLGLKGFFLLRSATSRNVFVTQYLRPFVESSVLVWTCFCTALLSIFILSSLKSSINRASSYGFPELNFAWVVSWILFSFIIVQGAFPSISLALKLRSRNITTYSTLPPSVRRPQEFSDDEDDEVSEGLLSERRHGLSPSIDEWLPHGLLTFWFVMLVLVVWLSKNGIDGPVVLTYWFFFSGLSALVTFFASYFVHKWWRKSLAGIEIESWKVDLIKSYENHLWVVQLCVSSLVPFFFTLDLVEELLTSLPSLIAEGVTDCMYDMAIAFIVCIMAINILPVFHSIENRRFLMVLCFSSFLVTYLAACLVKPFSYDRPHKMRFEQTWDISKNTSELTLTPLSTMSKERQSRILAKKLPWLPTPTYQLDTIIYKNLPTPNIPLPNSTKTTQLIKINLNNPKKTQNFTYITGSFTGSPTSRICDVSTRNHNISKDPLYGIWIDHQNLQTDWQTVNATAPGGPFDGEVVGSGLGWVDLKRAGTLMRRGGGDGGMTGRFLIRFGEAVGGVEVVVRCYHSEVEVEGVYGRVGEGIPDWMTITHGRFGGVVVSKSVPI